MSTINPEEIVARECRFATFVPVPAGNNRDLHVVKEILHTKDGHKIPNLRLIWDYKRSYYITQTGQQNHKDKKEYEHKKHLIEFKTRQSDLPFAVARSLNGPAHSGNLRRICRSPYVYGADILSTALIKQGYKRKYPDVTTGFTKACFDIETDMIHGTGTIIMATLSFGKKVFTAIRADVLTGHTNVLNKLQEKLNFYIGEYVEKRGIEWEVLIVEKEIDIVLECFKRAHEWQPDFVAIWNITFDLEKVLVAIEKAGMRPEDIFSDPSIPKSHRYFKYKKGPKQKVTASGKVTPIKPSAQWHTVYCPASFYFIDAMCAYRHIRTGEGEETSYALDAILDKVLGIRKLKFTAADRYVKGEWHAFMQEHYILEYIIYNVFDCVSMEELDEETKDLEFTLPMLSKMSDFENFKSQPRRLADDLHFFYLEHDKVFATTSDEMATEDDDEVTDLKGWIVTLPAHLVADNGLRIIEENPELRSNIRGHVGDLDVSASYPTGECVFNISKETTKKELCDIEGIPETIYRAQGINLSAGHTNSVEFCQVMYGLPSLEKMLLHYQAQRMQALHHAE